jgi:hypothetical protein
MFGGCKMLAVTDISTLQEARDHLRWILEHLTLTVESRTILEALLIEVEIKLRDARPS